MSTRTIDAKQFRQALGRFATGVTVITAEHAPGRVFGMTANSFASVSLDPLQVLVCIEERAKVLPVVLERRRFGVSVLREDQAAWSEYFAQPEQTDHDEARLGVRFSWIEAGVPVLEGTLAQLGCTMVASYMSGDHTIVVAEVSSLSAAQGEPLVFFGGRYRKIAPAG